LTAETSLERNAITVALQRVDRDLAELNGALEVLAGAVEAGDSLVAAAAHRRFPLAHVGLAGRRHRQPAYEPVVAKLQLYTATAARVEQARCPSAPWVSRETRLVTET
jgi:DNA-binding GntR family transcriptional regulator